MDLESALDGLDLDGLLARLEAGSADLTASSGAAGPALPPADSLFSDSEDDEVPMSARRKRRQGDTLGATVAAAVDGPMDYWFSQRSYQERSARRMRATEAFGDRPLGQQLADAAATAPESGAVRLALGTQEDRQDTLRHRVAWCGQPSSLTCLGPAPCAGAMKSPSAC